jgi:hypothetical protein
MFPRIIGIKGLAGHGKDTVANMISEYLSPNMVCKLSLAEPLKEIVSILTGVPKNSIDSNKGTFLPEFGMNMRCLLQKLGTDVMRDQFHPDTWIQIAERRLGEVPAHQVVVIPDIRFENEIQFVRRNRGIVIQVHRPNLPLDPQVHSHVSEQLKADCDFTIVNEGSLQDLRIRVYEVMKELFPSYSTV